MCKALKLEKCANFRTSLDSLRGNHGNTEMILQNKFEPIVTQAARYRRHFFCIRFIGLDFSPLVKNCQSNSLADTTFHNLTIVIFNLFCHRPRITICFVLFVCWAKIEKNGGQPCKFKENLLHIL